MIILAILVYAGFIEGMTIPAIAFVLAGAFDLSMANEIFSCD